MLEMKNTHLMPLFYINNLETLLFDFKLAVVILLKIY